MLVAYNVFLSWRILFMLDRSPPRVLDLQALSRKLTTL